MEEGQTMRVAVRDVVSNGLRDTAVEYQMAGCAKRLVQSSQIHTGRKIMRMVAIKPRSRVIFGAEGNTSDVFATLTRA